MSIYTYIDLYIRDFAVCLYCTGYTALSWCNFSSTCVLNLTYVGTLLFAHSNIFRDFCNSIGYSIQNISKIRDCAVCLHWVIQCYPHAILYPRLYLIKCISETYYLPTLIFQGLFCNSMGSCVHNINNIRDCAVCLYCVE